MYSLQGILDVTLQTLLQILEPVPGSLAVLASVKSCTTCKLPIPFTAPQVSVVLQLTRQTKAFLRTLDWEYDQNAPNSYFLSLRTERASQQHLLLIFCT